MKISKKEKKKLEFDIMKLTKKEKIFLVKVLLKSLFISRAGWSSKLSGVYIDFYTEESLKPLFSFKTK
ncbi:MAG: hypothetical protein ACOC2U_00300 [bacterium]